MLEGECSMLMGIAILVTHCTLYHCTTVVYLGGTVGSWETGGTLFSSLTPTRFRLSRHVHRGAKALPQPSRQEGDSTASRPYYWRQIS